MSSIFKIDNEADVKNITATDPKQFGKNLELQLTIFGYNLLWATLILISGLIVIWIFSHILSCILLRRKSLNRTLNNFILKVTRTILHILLFSICVDLLGFQVLSIATILGAIAFAIGLALSGFLQNFVAGVYLIVQRPISLGDYIIASGEAEGSVIDIGVVSTTIRTPDYRQIIIPNQKLASENIINYDKEDIRRCDCKFSVPYTEDVNFIRKIILRICQKDPRILSQPEPSVRVISINTAGGGPAATSSSSILISARAFVQRQCYWELYFSFPELIKLEFERCGVKIQIPQTEVHLNQIDPSKIEKPELDQEYLDELENAIIHEIKTPEQEEDTWAHRLTELGGKIPMKHLWGWHWRQKASDSVKISKSDTETASVSTSTSAKNLDKDLTKIV